MAVARHDERVADCVSLVKWNDSRTDDIAELVGMNNAAD